MTQLALVIDLNVCVGCHACVTSCKEWNTSGEAGPLPDTQAYGEHYRGTFFNRVQTFEVGCFPATETVHFPKSCLHCEAPPCVPVCPTGASHKRKEDGIVLVDYYKCIGCKYCSWACPYGARELDDQNRVMKKCTETNIHHNYAALENHFDKSVWVHRKGATSAKIGEKGIIPGSMGTSSYIVEGLGNVESFQSCSHGAGRKMGRMDACRNLIKDECDEAMGDVVYDRWGKLKKFGRKLKTGELFDLSESPLAYKNIDEVIEAELDLIKPLVKLQPIGVVKG